MGSSGRGATRAAKLATPGPGVKAGCDEVGRNARRFKLERARSTSTLRRTVNQTDSPDRYRGRHGFVATVLLAICVFAARGSFAQAGPSPADGVAQVIAATDGGVPEAAGSKRVRMSVEPALQKQMERLMRTYTPMQGAMVAIDPKTGKVLSLVEFAKDGKSDGLAIRPLYPAASVFKIITGAALLEA